jgi:hypothetical protein
MTANTPAEEIAKQMPQSEAPFQGMEHQRVPSRNEIREVLAVLNGMSEGISRIVEQWNSEYRLRNQTSQSLRDRRLPYFRDEHPASAGGAN